MGMKQAQIIQIRIGLLGDSKGQYMPLAFERNLLYEV